MNDVSNDVTMAVSLTAAPNLMQPYVAEINLLGITLVLLATLA